MNVLPGALYSTLRDKLRPGPGRARPIEGVANIGVRPEAIAFTSLEDAHPFRPR